MDRPGLNHEGPGAPPEHAADRKQEDEAADKIDPGFGSRRCLAIEHVHPDMAVMQERIGGADHEDRAVHIDDGFLHEDGADAEDIAHDHDRELHHDHRHE